MSAHKSINGFKVVRRAGECLVSAAACTIPEVAKWELGYRQNQITEAPPEARQRGYGIAIFTTLRAAKLWATRWARESNYRLEIWTAEGEQLESAAPQKIDSSHWSAWADTCGDSGTQTIYFTSEWPLGTLLCSRIRLLKCVETITAKE